MRYRCKFIFLHDESISPTLSMKENLVLDWIIVPNLSCPFYYRIIHPGPLPYDFTAPSTIDIGLGHETYLANGMLEHVTGGVICV